MTPSQLTLRLLKKDGYESQSVERWNSFARVRQDLFGIIDIIAIKQNEPIRGIQATSYSNHSARKKKSIDSPFLQIWKDSGGVFEIVSWRKVKNRWVEKREVL